MYQLFKDDECAEGNLYGAWYKKCPLTVIERFGSMENVRDKARNLGKAFPNSFFQEAADGFCSWFILQYIRGYKPFVTLMSKEINIEIKL